MASLFRKRFVPSHKKERAHTERSGRRVKGNSPLEFPSSIEFRDVDDDTTFWPAGILFILSPPFLYVHGGISPIYLNFTHREEEQSLGKEGVSGSTSNLTTECMCMNVCCTR